MLNKRIVLIVVAVIMGVIGILYASGFWDPKDAFAAYKKAGDGVAYCLSLSDVARHQAWRISGVGVFLAVVAGASVLLGSVVGPGPDPSAERTVEGLVRKNRGVLLTFGGAMIAPLALFAFSNSDSAALAASAATQAVVPESERSTTGTTAKERKSIEEEDRAIYYECVRVRAAWLKSRKDSTDLVRSSLDGWTHGPTSPSGTTARPRGSGAPTAPPAAPSAEP